MTENRQRIVAVGEVMVELARGHDGRYALSFGGDTFNTAVYLARAGVPVAYATALGDDPYSDGVLAMAWRTILLCACPDACPASTSSKRMRPANAASTTGATVRRRAICSSCRN